MPAADAKRLALLLKELDDTKPEVRVRATEELVKLKDLAEPALKELQASKPPLEVAKRVAEVLRELPDELPEQRRLLWVIEDLEQVGTPEARKVLERLASGEPASRITRAAKTALGRLNQRTP